MRLTLILLSPLQRQGGNFSTISRISSYLTSHGHRCLMEDPKMFQTVSEFQAFLHHKNVDLVIGIHAYRSGCLIRASTVPSILILGGTDINEFYKDINKLSVMTEAVHHARYVVVFGQSMWSRASSLWPEIPSNKVKEIKQAVITDPSSSFCLLQYLKSNNHIPAATASLRNITVFLLVGGIRPVKDPVFLIDKFSEWHREDSSVYYVIIGPKIDAEYFEETFWPAVKQSSGVIYIPGLSKEDTHAAMRDCFSLVNSSKSEGMSLAVLEAMDMGIPVLARRVTGNQDLVQDRKTGLLYDTPQEFVLQARSIMSTPEQREQIVARARAQVAQHHCYEAEGHAYMSLVRTALSEPC
ncbi:glycosyltransferase 1 domain-containing protein 1-like [Haliotis rufescens]|uniref:glycosyltransferase 1 domain-containing protein 1-like n=1 Tax=Haliotis rufescens TaxID=6454 RepID=UPI00201F16F8|nr:glycosyltransferase 1 domain-containing protein 1-like [Haliotis rufescens]XP_048241176.1 glycosyltransferase 1 domain-containing protein 1-like [Haliotis rufescens]XP_048241177.1 glycosyltransferase 1 domain-containing protein 1-like [Haliotis rufescens]XP_048241178.1 glycosyltransferase 1 domain-containing protein 1-like [Haliotis rufescens]